MKIYQVTDPEFREYGRIIKGIDFSELLEGMEKTPCPDDVVYVASDPELEKIPVCEDLRRVTYGELPVQVGYCNGHNNKLNALEYHRSSEVDIAATDLILMVGRQQDIDQQDFTYDTGKVECFLVPAGTAVELYATTLHFAPCSVSGKEFRMGVALPRGTNEPLDVVPEKTGENQLLLQRNKWLLAHKDSGLDKDGAWIGLVGENIEIR